MEQKLFTYVKDLVKLSSEEIDTFLCRW